MQLPRRIPGHEPGTFGAFTIAKRFPRILGDVKAVLAGGGSDPRWDALETALLGGGAIDVSLASATTPFWGEFLAGCRGRAWRDLCFFELEFLFYNCLNSIAEDIRPGIDVFKLTRQDALKKSLPDVARKVEHLPGHRLRDFARLALGGNRADLSQLAGDRSPDGTVLLDDSPSIEAFLDDNPQGTVQLLADNAGSELCFDLLLVDALLSREVETVVLQLKPSPMFVSDALIEDAVQTMHALFAWGSQLRSAADRLLQAARQGRLVFEAPFDWAEPRHINELEPELTSALQGSCLVLAKGDLNSRRFFQDRAWSAETPVRVASVARGMDAVALRVLKSDCVVGLSRAQAERLFAADEQWRSNGKYSMIHRVGWKTG